VNILLVYPRSNYGAGVGDRRILWASTVIGSPSITLPHIAAITPDHYQVEILDENYEDIDFSCNADIVGIPCLTETANHVYEIADRFREHGKTVVLGGYHPSALPHEASQHADSVVIGEAELTWPQLLDDFEKHKLQRFYTADEAFDMAIIPHIRRDLIKHQTVLGAIQTTRGCPNQCEFCAITSFYNHGVKHRPLQDVISEIQEMPNDFFIVNDPSLTVNPRYSRAFFKALIKEKIKKGWLASGNASVLSRVDNAYLDLARKAGCVEWFIGLESVSQEALNATKKQGNKVKDFKKMIQRLHDHGMTVQSGIIFGFDQDSPDVFDKTLEAINDWEIDIVEPNILTPFPGTPLFDRLEKEDRLLTKDWSRYNLVDVVFKPNNMSEKELYEGTRKVAKEFYSVPKVFMRIAKVMVITKRIAGFIPAGSNLSYRKYYKRDFAF